MSTVSLNADPVLEISKPLLLAMPQWATESLTPGLQISPAVVSAARWNEWSNVDALQTPAATARPGPVRSHCHDGAKGLWPQRLCSTGSCQVLMKTKLPPWISKGFSWILGEKNHMLCTEGWEKANPHIFCPYKQNMKWFWWKAHAEYVIQPKAKDRESVTFIALKIGFMTIIKLKHLSLWGTFVSSGVAYLSIISHLQSAVIIKLILLNCNFRKIRKKPILNKDAQ